MPRKTEIPSWEPKSSSAGTEKVQGRNRFGRFYKSFRLHTEGGHAYALAEPSSRGTNKKSATPERTQEWRMWMKLCLYLGIYADAYLP